MILLLTFPQDKHASTDRHLPRDLRLRVRDPSVVHIDAARLHEPPGFALRWRKTNPAIIFMTPIPVELISVAWRSVEEHPQRWKEHLQLEFL